jgi:hypothetical protein
MSASPVANRRVSVSSRLSGGAGWLMRAPPSNPVVRRGSSASPSRMLPPVSAAWSAARRAAFIVACAVKGSKSVRADLRDGTVLRHGRIARQRRTPLAARHQDGLGGTRDLLESAVRDQARGRLADGGCDERREVLLD